MHRTQLLLETEQYRQGRQLAEARGRSVSDVVRELIDLGLRALREWVDWIPVVPLLAASIALRLSPFLPENSSQNLLPGGEGKVRALI